MPEAQVPSWMNTGYQAAHAEQERREQGYGPDRVWMPAGEGRELVFIDDPPISVKEHQVKINQSWRNWYTCLEGTGEEPVCCEKAGVRSRSFVSYYTVVDLTLWRDKGGNEHQYELKLFPAKMETLKRLELKSSDRAKGDGKGGLVGCMFKVTRLQKDSPSSGDEFDFKKEADTKKMFDYVTFRGKKLSDMYTAAQEKPEEMEKLKRLFQLEFDAGGKLIQKVPTFNYIEVLKPKSPKELRGLLAGVKVDEPDAKSESGPSAPEVPF
jgi:hypothetical protein